MAAHSHGRFSQLGGALSFASPRMLACRSGVIVSLPVEERRFPESAKMLEFPNCPLEDDEESRDAPEDYKASVEGK